MTEAASLGHSAPELDYKEDMGMLGDNGLRSARDEAGQVPTQRTKLFTPWVIAASLSCFAFAVCLSLNIHPMADGMWFWYARLWLLKVHLYRDLHLALQPLFVLLTALFQWAFGFSWMASQALPLAQVLFYLIALTGVTRFISSDSRVRAALILGIFTVTTASVFYRFDDYHLTSDCLVAVSLLVLLCLGKAEDAAAIQKFALVNGLACGLLTANRLNDGVMLVAEGVMCVYVLAKTAKLRAVATYLIAAFLAFAAVILATHDSPATWLTYSVLHAASAKGGAGKVLLYPLSLPIRLLRAGANFRVPLLVVFASTFLYACHSLRKELLWRKRPIVLISLGLWLLAGAVWVYRLCLINAAGLLLTFGVFPLLLLFAAVCGVSAVRRRAAGLPIALDPAATLFLFPLGQLFAGAMTSAKSLPDLYPPLGQALILVPFLATPGAWRRRTTQWVTSLCIVFGFIYVTEKVFLPYDWNFYVSPHLFRDRTWFKHPVYGEMYVPSAQLAFNKDACDEIKSSQQATLLSMPYPYANYFCAVRPWRDTVQTWFDTSTNSDIERLEAALQKEPPRWIVYQHARDAIIGHQNFFHEGQRTAHLELDDLINARIRTGQWRIRRFTCVDGADTVLIETVPVGERVDSENYRKQYREEGLPYCALPH